MTDLVAEATKVISTAGKLVTPVNVFLACLVLLSSAPAQGELYWAYVPKPPLVHPVTWHEKAHIKVMTSVTEILGGSPTFMLSKNQSSVITYEGKSDSAPMCFSLLGSSVPGCLPVSYRTFVTDAPEKKSLTKKPQLKGQYGNCR